MVDELEISVTQRAAVAALTDQRIANIFAMADLVGDFNPEVVEFLRCLGDMDHKPLRKFLLDSRHETFGFLADLRPDELAELGNAIENARAIRRGGRLLKWSVVTLFGAFVGMSVVWDKVSAIFQAKGVR